MSATSLNGGSVRVLWTESVSAVVTITGSTTVNFTVNGSPVTFPYTLASSATFDTSQTGDYTVSVLHNGVEVANTPDGTRIVHLEGGGQVIFAPSPDGGGNSSGLLTQLSATYLPQAVPALGTVANKQNVSNPSTWGLHIDKSSAGRVGADSGCVVWSIAGSNKWAAGMDVSDVEFVPVYDFTGDGGGSADIMRVAPGSKWLIARQAGAPSRGNRVTISSDDGDATLGSPLTNLLYLAASSGSSATYHIKGQLDSTEVWGITKSGQMGLGATYAGTSSKAFLEVKQGAVIKSGVGEAAFVLLQTSGNATNRTWVPQVDPTTGHFNIKDNNSGNTVVQVQAGALASQIIAGTNFVWLGAATSTVGFFGSTGSAKSTGWTTLTGTATKAAGSLDTSTVTLPQLAQVVKALLDLNLSRNFISA